MSNVINFPKRGVVVQKTLHLMTQRDQPYGSQRRCCENCGLMMVGRPDSFWTEHVYTDDEKHFHSRHPGLTPCKI